MPDEWADLLEKAELAVGACSRLADSDLVGSVADTVREARMRLSYPEEVAVAALVGGTGSGKSSLLNAVMGAEIVETGGMRPTTEAPVAVVPASIGEAMDRYLELLGVEEIHHGGPHDRLCLIDMPDTDSVEVGHRIQVERLLPIVDAVIWVMDPEKYRDATLHHEQLTRLAGDSDRFVFVLNQVDRVDAPTRETLLADLGRALAEDGIPDPVLVATAASPPAGPPIGIDELVEAVQARSGTAEALRRKLISDLRRAVEMLLAAAGGSGLDFDRRAAQTLDETMGSLADGEETAAVLGLTGFLTALAEDAGGPIADEIEEVAVRVPLHIRAMVEESGPPLTESVIAPVRSLLASRARANALLADLALTLQAMDANAAR